MKYFFGYFLSTIYKIINSLSDSKKGITRDELIKKAGIKAAIALKPETPAGRIKPFLNKIDQVLVMTVHPGFYGGKFLPKMLPKIKQIRRWSRKIDIEVDGGIRPGTAKQCAKAGANIFCAGSFIFKSKNIKTSIEELKKDIR